MGVLELDITLSNLDEEIEEGLGQLRQEGADAMRVQEVCARMRQSGCGLLLADLDVDGFQRSLFQSALLYEWLLDQRARRPRLDAYYLCKSRALPILDVLALGRMDVAQRIALKLDTPWQPKMEPEEDFRYLDLLLGPLLAGQRNEELMLAFERSMEEPSTRLGLVTAMVRGEADAFWEALAALTREWETDIEEQRRRDALDPYFANTEAFVFIEGIALVRLASLWGLSTEARLPFMPQEAFLPPSRALPEGFRP